jgi:hypothetical protein
MSTRTREQELDDAWRQRELPPLSAVDRLALRLGLALILWGQRHAEAEERAEQARRSRAADRAAQSRDAAFAHRLQAGPPW